jgi:hypothetical protein
MKKFTRLELDHEAPGAGTRMPRRKMKILHLGRAASNTGSFHQTASPAQTGQMLTTS